MSLMKNLITIIGTTGVGKSQLSVELAKAVNGEIINGDSMQVYRGLDTITNKHPVADQENIPHHLLGHIDWSHEYSVKQFEQEVTSLVDDIHARGKVPILVGGTHYYNQAVLFKNSTVSSVLGSSSSAERALTQEQQTILDDPLKVSQWLQKVDPVVAQKFHPNDVRRVRRALEIYFLTGQRASDLYEKQQYGDQGTIDLRYISLILWVWCEKSVLDSRLDARVDQMVKGTLFEEVNELYQEHLRLGKDRVDLERAIWQVIGYKQFLPWLEGREDSPNGGIETLKIATRQYATRQTKWISKKLISLLDQIKTRNPDSDGTLALLDATDLSQWEENVCQRGISIAKEFLAQEPFSIPLAPPGLESLLLPRSRDLEFTKDQWKHHVCQYCKDPQGEPLVVVGDRTWEDHVNSRKHRYAQRAHSLQRDCH